MYDKFISENIVEGFVSDNQVVDKYNLSNHLSLGVNSF